MDMPQLNAWQGKMLGRYQLIRLLERGSVNEVWLAEDTQLRRSVAVKLFPCVRTEERQYLQAFEHEAGITASLEHPHILPIHDFGEQQITEDEVVTYLVMPYITDGSLRERLHKAGSTLPPAEAVSYLRQAAEAIDYAHSRQVLHGNIKPSNLLLQQGWLFVADFGVAKVLTAATRPDRAYAGEGVPVYIAPEQVQGKTEAASDRYCFALVAYELCTGRVPFQGDTPSSILIKQMREVPPAPRRLNPALPPAVEQALLWGLAKQPAERPASCLTLVAALEHGWQMSLSTQYGSDATMLTPHRRSENAQASLPQVPQTPLFQTLYARTEPSVSRPTAPETPHLYPHNAPTYLSSGSQAPASIPVVPVQETPQRKLSRRGLVVGGTLAALAVAGGAVALSPILRSPTMITQRTSIPQRPAPGPKNLVAGVPLLSLTGHTKTVSAAKWDITGRYLATGGEDAAVMLWDVGSALQSSSTALQSISTPLKSWRVPHPIFVNYLCWAGNGRAIAVVAGDSAIYLFDAFNGASSLYQLANAQNTLSGPGYFAIACSPTANTFAAASFVPEQTQLQVDLWQTSRTTGPVRMLTANDTGTARTSITDYVHPLHASRNINALGWSSDGTLLAAHTNFGTVTRWQTATGSTKQMLNLPSRSTKGKVTDVFGESLAWSPTNAQLLAVSDLDVVTLWDVERNNLLRTLKSQASLPSLTGLTWSSNGQYLAGGYAGSNRVYVWDMQATAPDTQATDQLPKLVFPQSTSIGHTGIITDVAWSPDGRYIATASGDATVIVWRVNGS
jgi:serine/threonine protein kinase